MTIFFLGVILVPFLYWLIPAGFFQLLPRMGQEGALKLFLLLAISLSFKNKFIRLFLLYTAGWYLLSVILYLYNPARYYLIAKAIQGQTDYVMFGSMMVVLVYLWPRPIRRKRWMDFLCVGAIIQSLFAIPNLFNQYPVDMALMSLIGGKAKVALPDQLVGFGMECQNYLAAYLALSIPFFFRSKKWALGLLVVVPILLLCKTTSAVMGATAAILVLHPHSWPIALAGFAGFFLFDFSGGSIHSRIDLWKEALGQMGHPLSWLIGQGPGTQTASMQKHLHNEYLNILHDYGSVGLIMVIGFIVSLRKEDKLLVASMVAFLVHATLNHPLHLPITAFIFCVTAGLLMRGKKDDNIQV